MMSRNHNIPNNKSHVSNARGIWVMSFLSILQTRATHHGRVDGLALRTMSSSVKTGGVCDGTVVESCFVERLGVIFESEVQ